MCSIFIPDKWTNQTDKMSEFNHWLSEAEAMKERMEELRFTGIKKYQMLRYRLEGQARQCTRIDFPNDESYDRAMNLLKDRYYDKALAMREWYRKLKNVPKIESGGLQKFTIENRFIRIMLMRKRNQCVYMIT